MNGSSCTKRAYRCHGVLSSIHLPIHFATLLAIFLMMQPIVCGQTVRDWTGGGASDNYTSPLNWSPFNVPDTPSETAQFNLAGGFEVTHQSGVSTTVDDLLILAGDINFAATGSVSAFYTVNDDLIVDGGDFTLSNAGGIGNVTVTVNDELAVGPDSLLTLNTGGRINANGDVLIDGGTLSTKVSTGSSFNLAPNQKLTASNSGAVSFDADITLPADTVWQFQSGAQFSSDDLDIAEDTTFALTDSSASTAVTAVNGNAVLEGTTTTWSNTGRLNVAGSGHLQVNSGSDVTSNMATLNGSGVVPSGTIARATVDGKDSSWTISGNITFGGLTVGDGESAELNITNGGTVASLRSDIGSLSFSSANPFDRVPLGVVNVDGKDSTWNSGITLVGSRQYSIVTVANAARVSSGRTIIDGAGTWIVEGEDSQWIINTSLIVASNNSLSSPGTVPCECEGGVRIRNGGFVSTDTLIASQGFAAPQFGAAFDAPVVVDAVGSELVVSTLATFGGEILTGGSDRAGTGYLEVTAGGRATINKAAFGIVDGALGLALVSGSGSVWENTGNLYVGGSETTAAGTGEITLADQGLLEIGGGLTVWTDGRVMLQGGRLKFDSTQATVDGQINFEAGTLQLTDSAGYTIGSGTPVVENLLGNDDMVLLRNQSLAVDQQLTIPAAKSITTLGPELAGQNIVNNGLLNAQDTTITTQTGLVNQADLVLINATVNGPLTNAANAAATIVGTVEFNGLTSGPGNYFGPGTANFNGGLAIGASPAEVAFEGDIALSAANTLFVEIGGLLADDDFDRLMVDGLAMLSGTLDIELIESYTPAVGDSFEILTAAEVVGMFDIEVLPDLGGLLWNVEYSPTNVTLSVTTPFTADFDLDGDVDHDDLAKWRADYGSPGSDADGDGDSDGADLMVWQQQFGSGVNPPAASQAVPEPSTVLLSLLCLACVLSGVPGVTST